MELALDLSSVDEEGTTGTTEVNIVITESPLPRIGSYDGYDSSEKLVIVVVQNTEAHHSTMHDNMSSMVKRDLALFHLSLFGANAVAFFLLIVGIMIFIRRRLIKKI